MEERIGIVLTCYNRPEYLKTTLDSLLASDIPQGTILILIDDYSTDEKTKKLYYDFNDNKFVVYKIRNHHNIGVWESLPIGFLLLKEFGCKIFVNLDSDVTLKQHWLTTEVDLLNRFPDRIITGFNAGNTPRHPVKETFNDYYVKQTIGGVNIMFKSCMLDTVILSLQNHKHVWDWMLSDELKKRNQYPLCTRPSVIQHIGVESTLDHRGGDIALDY